jgi:type IV pilus assembly protein PilA
MDCNLKHSTSKRAFTLVEVIVVAVIVAILAAVAIPQYQAYVVESRQSAVDNLAESGAAMANSWYRRKGVAPSYVADLQMAYDANKYTITISGDSVKVVEATGSSPLMKSSRSFK